MSDTKPLPLILADGALLAVNPEPIRGLDAAELDPEFARIRPRKCCKVPELAAGTVAGLGGDQVVRVPGHVYGIGRVITVRKGNRSGTRWIDIEYPGEPGVFSLELELGRALELHDPDGPKN